MKTAVFRGARVKTAVLGPGGVGGFVAAALARAGTPVTVVSREETAVAIERDGIAVESVRLGSFVAHPRAAATLDEPVDLLIVATKATTLPEALARVRAEPALVVPLLNGLDHLQLLRARLADRVVAATIRIESERVAPGRIVQSSRFLALQFAGDAGPLARAFDDAGIPTQRLDSEADVMWDKLVRLNALALTTSAYDAPIGEIRARHRRDLEACVREAAAVAAVEGAEVDADEVLAQLDDAHASLSSSMARDLAAGAEPELDAIAGAVLRAAEHGAVKCPTIEALTARVASRAGISPR